MTGLADDIRDAMMDYQVRIHMVSTWAVPKFILRLRCNKTSTTRTINSSWVSFNASLLHLLTGGQDTVERSLLSGMYHTPDAGYLCGNREGADDHLEHLLPWFSSQPEDTSGLD